MPRRRSNHRDVSAISGAKVHELPTMPINRPSTALKTAILGAWAAAHAPSMAVFNAVDGLLIGMVGSSCTFAPLMADTSLWFERRRGIAVAICASGNYLGGAIWPPVIQHFVEVAG